MAVRLSPESRPTGYFCIQWFYVMLLPFLILLTIKDTYYAPRVHHQPTDDTNHLSLTQDDMARIVIGAEIRQVNIVPYTNSEMTDKIIGAERGELFRRNQNDPILEEFKPKIFEFLLNNKRLCAGNREQPLFLLWIYSAPAHTELRNALRNTWARPSLIEGYPSVTVFFMGTSMNETVMQNIYEESVLYGDVVLVDYVETYHKLPYKGITALWWTYNYCLNARFIVKADDDLFVDMKRVVTMLHVLKYKLTGGAIYEHAIAGMVTEFLEVPRDWPGDLEKVNVRPDIMPDSAHLPIYLFGWTYLLTTNLIPKMLQAAMMTPVFHIDDVFMTGVLIAQIPNVTMINIEHIDNRRHQARQYLSKEAKTPREIYRIFCETLTSDFFTLPMYYRMDCSSYGA